jgi:hypothetical protein
LLSLKEWNQRGLTYEKINWRIQGVY